MKRDDIELKLNELLNYLNDFVSSNGYPPTVREICNDMNFRSTATAYNYLERLKSRGLIQKAGFKNRALGISQPQEDFPCAAPDVKFAVAPLLGEVACGTPIFAEENIEDYYPLPAIYKNPENIFLLKARGESMVDAGICSGDRLICQKQSTANNGDIVVALLDDSATVKRFYKKNDHVVLHPENDNYTDIIVRDVQILGKVVGLYRTLS